MADGPRTVLVVDDDTQLLRFYRDFLRDRYAVRTAASGAEALDRIDGVDLVLLDRRLPGLSGREVLDELRIRGFEGLVGLVTVVDPDTDIVDMPFDDYLVKPVTRAAVLELVETLLRRAAYDERVRDCLALASKLAVLEADRTSMELEADPAYRALVDRLAERRAAAEPALASLTEEELAGVFRDGGGPAHRSEGAGHRFR